MGEIFATALETFASDLQAKFALPLSFSPEDQLKEPVGELLRGAGRTLDLDVAHVTEAHIQESSSRPDIGVAVNSLLAGHVELKAPGKGANPNNLKGADKRQWQNFRDLPNLIYTDSNEWALYRSGKRVGRLVRVSGDVPSEGSSAVGAGDAAALLGLLQEFLRWKPIVSSTPKGLAETIAPICRLLRSNVLEALRESDSNLSNLADDWRRYLFPDADDKQFADAYAQTFTYALLLARLSGASALSVPQAVMAIRTGHRLLADTLKILGDDAARDEIRVSADLLERVIGAVDVEALTRKSKGDPWLYFYEDFLAAYDPQMRKNRGVYFTPVPVVQTQVRLVAELLRERFDAEFSFVDPKVVTLDPAAGTGTYVLAAVEHGLDQVARVKGPGMRAAYATTAAANMHAFEILVGPYAVAHLRLTQQLLGEGGKLPEGGVHVYLTDTLESPFEQPPQLPLLYKPLGEEHKRAQKIKAETPILVCIGNPPYHRQHIRNQSIEKRKGGWVRYGEKGEDGAGILQDFIAPLVEAGEGLHAKNLYNDYVYYWRWALWKVFESESGPGIVSFITASSYLRGPGFAGMRKVMRETFDELWIIDLEGDNLGARKTDNVFAIQTPVAIAVGVRYGGPRPATPAASHYTKVDGTEDDKLRTLAAITNFEDLKWQDCLSDWTAPFLPITDKDYWRWPLLTDLFPWQENGMQFKRTWPIGETMGVLERRWSDLCNASDRKRAFRETGDRKIAKQYAVLNDPQSKARAIASLAVDAPMPTPIRIAYRSFDRHWALVDNRLADRIRPSLHQAHGECQVYMTSLLTNVLGEGPSAVATALIPDLDHFRGSFGGKHVIPLWRDAAATEANVAAGILEGLAVACDHPVQAEHIFAYCYAVLATPRYVARFWDELTIPGPRIPITKDPALFKRAAALGRRLIWLHTYGERFVPPEMKPGRLPQGTARCKVGTPATPDDYPETFSYDCTTHELHVGKGVFNDVRPEVWEFSVSGLEVVKSWLGYRMRKRAGRKSSPLDEIRPEVWRFDEELLDLLWVLDATVDMLPQVTQVLEGILSSELLLAHDLPQPTDAERRGAKGAESRATPLFDDVGIDMARDGESNE